MNLFFIGSTPKEIARSHCNKHVVKMILEIAQMLCAAHHIGGCPIDTLYLYRLTHANHPMSIWVRECAANYMYAARIALELCDEYACSYGRGSKRHASEPMLMWLMCNLPSQFGTPPAREVRVSKPVVRAITGNPDGCTPVPLCMPEEYYRRDLVDAYRTYYMRDVTFDRRWPDGGIPQWVV